MNNINFEKLTEDIITKQDLLYLLDDINQAQDLIYQEEKKFGENLEGKLKEILKEQDFSNREKQDEFLSQLKTRLEDIPQVKLTLAFPPSESFLEETSHELENEIGTKIIIDLTVKPEIIGGAIIEYGGNYLDFSLAKQISQFLTSNASILKPNE